MVKIFSRAITRANYWSDSAVGRFIYDYNKPYAASLEEWKEIKETAKKNSRIRYWIREEFLDKLQDFFLFPLDVCRNIRYYLRNRFITKSHTLTSKLEKGVWYDLDTRILHCLFDELVNFVEIEKANIYCATREKEEQKLNGREAGLAYLDWEMTLTNEDGSISLQAQDAETIYNLYRWWTEERPARKDAYEASGWSKYCDEKRKKGLGLLQRDPLENEEKTRKILANLRALEDKYKQEDTKMLIDLIEVREALWT